MNKKLIALIIPFFVFVLFLPMDNPVAASSNISIYIDRENQYFDQNPIMENNRTLVPMRHIFERLGATIHWDAKNNIVTAKKNGKLIQLKINSINAIVDGKTVVLDVPAKVINGRTLVPLRFVTQALGGNVEWDGNAQIVYITTSQSERENILNTIFKIEMSTLHILHEQMEREVFYGSKKQFSQIEPKLKNYYTSSYIQNVWKPFYNSEYFSEWYTHTTYMFDFLLNEYYLSRTLKFDYEIVGSEQINFWFRDDPLVNEGPMGVTIRDHEYTLVNAGNGWRINRIN